MSVPVPHVVPIFATPFGVVTLPQAETLNSQLAELFAARAAREDRTAGDTPGRRVFVSRDDLLEWAEEPVRQALREILAGVTSVAASISELSGEELPEHLLARGVLRNGAGAVRGASRQRRATHARVADGHQFSRPRPSQ